jgi:peptide/nickel transport system substrate-binding protein
LNLSRRAFAAVSLLSAPALALGRLPYGGTLRLSLPFGLERIDPHDSYDPLAALLGAALFDSAFAMDASGASYPTLAAGPVEVVPGGLGVRLRPGLRDGSGRALTSRDLEFSLRRAAVRAARPLLQPFGTPVRDRKERELLVFPKGSARALEAALASPLVALVPRSFDPSRPEGTGAFRARVERDALRLSRNPHAARGGAYLDAIEVDPARDLSTALRRFEAGEVDVGWLGRGLHRVRAGSEMFRSPPLGWLVLRSGARLGAWGAPGVAQKLVAGLPPARVEGLGIELPPDVEGGARYAGPSAVLLTRGDSPHLVALAEALAQLFGGPITARGEGPTTLDRTRASGDFDFMLEVVRPLGSTLEQRYLTLWSDAHSQAARGAPALPSGLDGLRLARSATQATRTAVLAEFAVVAGRTGGFHALESWDLGAVWKG